MRAFASDASAMSPNPSILIRWEGFERVSDEQGYHYLVQGTEYQVSNRWWWWTEQLTLVGYPTIREARELTWLSQPVTLARYRLPRLGGDLIPLPSPGIANLRWTMPIPR
jgi:hypothetical protein